jgi:excisionase family DNA binding protein
MAIEETMTVKEAAAWLRVSIQTIYDLINAEVIPARRLGVRQRRILLDVADVEAYWKASKVGPKPIESKMAFHHIRPQSRARRPS